MPALRALGRPLLLLAGLGVAGLVLRALPVRDLVGQTGQAGHLGVAAFLALGTLACAVGVPRQVVAFAGGYAHGAWWGGFLALVAQVAGCLLDVLWARLIARDFVQARMAAPLLARFRRLLYGHPFGATLTLRLLPVGNNLLLNLAGGALGVAVTPFVLASAIGYLPQTVVFALLGGGVHIAHGTELVLGLLTFAVSACLGMWLLHRAAPAPTAVQEP